MEKQGRAMSDSKDELKRLMLDSMVQVHKLHLKRPFGNDKVSLDIFQYRIMLIIHEKSVSIQDLANMSELSRRIVISNISYMEKMNLVSKEKRDGREVELLLTEYGKTVLSEMNKQYETLISFINGKFSIKEEKSIKVFLSSFIDSIENVIE